MDAHTHKHTNPAHAQIENNIYTQRKEKKIKKNKNKRIVNYTHILFLSNKPFSKLPIKHGSS